MFKYYIYDTFLYNRPDGGHSKTDMPVAVVGGEFKTTYFNHLLKDIYPACREAR